MFVTGADGMLGTEVIKSLRRDSAISVVPSTIADMDITNLAAVRASLERHRPTHIIHCAAFTFVDTAEKEPLRAYQINAEGTKNLAFFCREFDIELIYLSTDYVFSGEKREPYLETDATGPINIYGKSKLLGETYIQALLEKYKIVRTSWLNGLGGDYTRNFIETMLRISETRSTISVVNDQTGRATFTFDLAPMLTTLLDVNAYGIFHVANSGICTWYELAREIFQIAGRTDVTVHPILSEQFRSAAKRPTYSVMSLKRTEQLGLRPLPDWRASLREYFRRREFIAQSLNLPPQVAPSPQAMRL
ncbi:MAG TPA: dTDP-4-dehydrorhamnose reductase [Candidatus Sumerlaeota bacterium]|nr:dTDP-4-dehydrorhamnose reductase [Candidatus Sumerlaeota bacterium]